MEASQQQRRPTIGQSAQRLRQQLGLDLDALDLADAFWLAQFIESDMSSAAPTTASGQDTPASSTDDPSTDPAPRRDKPEVNLYAEPRQTPAAAPTSDADNLEDGTETEDTETEDTETEDTETEDTETEDTETEDTETEDTETEDTSPTPPFPAPAAPALRTRLELGRSLRPLMRKVPSRLRQELDEAATVKQIAETGLWIPVVRPEAERWLELDFVVEDSKTTVIWERTIAELEQLMAYQGAFRTLRTWRLALPESASAPEIQLFPRWRDSREKHAAQRPRSPRELLDPSRRRLVLLLTDCTSSLWWRGIIQDILWSWAEVQPVSIMQLFPERLWTRTALSMGHIVRLGATAPGVPSARLDVTGLPQPQLWDLEDEMDPEETETDPVAAPDRRLVLPIVTPNPQPLKRWAQVIAGSGHEEIPGRVFELSWVQQMVQEQVPDSGGHPRTARQRVAQFRATASDLAQQLAGYMAATPVSLPVIDLLRDEFVPDARQDHVAEVLLSGLLQRCDADEEPDPCRYQFFGDDEPAGAAQRVRDLLLDSVPMRQSRQVLEQLSQRMTDRAGNSLKSFEAFLAAVEESGADLSAAALPLAQVGLDVLHRLGGPHAALARRYETVRQDTGPGRRTSSGSPALQTEEFTVVTFEVESDNVPPEVAPTPALESFDFTVATIQSRQTWFGLGKKWVIHRQEQQGYRFLELLPGDITLEMVAIPEGSFVMGSPDDEPERRDNESPQHEVTVPSFFMGRYPVTQAQWRLVAAMPQLERELKPDPSHFKGDNRPVEQVSWYDAMEFCARLSAHTGREYRLPSEAEWEYACRAGTTTPFHFGEMITTEVANYDGNSTYNGGPKGDNRGETTPVGHFGIANAWGLSDMHGNVWEWCLDHWHNNYGKAPTDGSAWLSEDEGSTRVLRGGSWLDVPRHCRSASRYPDTPRNDGSDDGFRLVSVAPRTL
ncbi:SUMF1/EgtB/PvdO family nonheme iron enzyme [Phormidium yuhuli AB48]|uniref:SUMF1/EgtB/PvdO family nonheme iron enzyme n=1 Tax=Phormidium yuhuli AB48 TaxID=2940671 RepID=A0ABY5AS55_9CYAN|nr:formylglycine-generating enzyme family protein [Phormidium yuhuli]USR91741.1 SUMF1/EgtB/PvdO family nonheme iron enzyme [Phormidium yuhuli AB48]